MCRPLPAPVAAGLSWPLPARSKLGLAIARPFAIVALRTSASSLGIANGVTVVQKNLTGLIEQASAAAAKAPDHLQEIAFSKAFDFLNGAGAGAPENATHAPSQGVSEDTQEAPKATTLDSLDPTEHPQVTHTRSALDNALLVLRAVREDLSIDGLSAPDVAEVLQEKFRCPVARWTLSRALNGAGGLVDRRKEGVRVVFRLMAPGDEHLDQILAGGDAPVTARKRSTKKPAAKRKKSSKEPDAGSKGGKAAVGRSYTPTKGVATLLESGYFQTPRLIGEIVKELKDNHGRIFKSSEVSPVLLRQIRTGGLVRKKNADGQYEYQQE